MRTTWQAIGSFLSVIENLIFLETCRICAKKCLLKNFRDRFPRTICLSCWRELINARHIFEWHKGEPVFAIASACYYQGKMKDLAHKLKYQNDRLLAYDLAHLMAAAWTRLNEHVEVRDAIIVPIPLHKQRLKSRGFNQAQLLGTHLSRLLDIPLIANCLERVKDTQPQFGLSRPDRHENVASAFAGNKARLSGKTIILVDDIYTSGATLSAAALEVLDCGAKKVVALTVARA